MNSMMPLDEAEVWSHDTDDSRERKRAGDLRLIRELLEDGLQAARTPHVAIVSTSSKRGTRRAARLALRYLWAVRHAPDAEVAQAARAAVERAIAPEDAGEVTARQRLTMLAALDGQLKAWRAPRPVGSSLESARNRAERAAVRCLWVERAESDVVVAGLARRIVAGLFPGVAGMTALLTTPPAWVEAEGTVLREDGAVAYLRFPSADAFGVVDDGPVQYVQTYLERVDTTQDGDEGPEVVEGPVTVRVGAARFTVEQAAVLRDVLDELVASAREASEPAAAAGVRVDEPCIVCGGYPEDHRLLNHAYTVEELPGGVR